MTQTILKLPKIRVASKAYSKLPDSPGVYIFWKEDFPIYVGKAVNLKRRVASYFNLNLETKTHRMMKEAEYFSYLKVGSELEALLLEAKLIKNFMPKYNIISKDDKHPLYIVITKEQFPRILSARKLIAEDQKLMASYGPFPSSANAKSVLKMIRKIFPYSDHKLGKKACLYSQIGLCSPCPNEVVHSTKYAVLRKEYLQNIKHIKAILDGKINKVKSDLEKEMKLLSDNENFENALEIRNKINMLNYVTRQNTKPEEYLENPNLYEDTINRELQSLKKVLCSQGLLLKKIGRIECYDIAHISGQNAAASMVTFIEGQPDKSYYRHFKINQKKGDDDYASMREVAMRRRKYLDKWGRPDLIIVDGGKGQLSVFQNIFESEKIPVVGIAKKNETLVIPIYQYASHSFKEYALKKESCIYLVQKIRDEAHRFARVYHHKLFKRSLFEN